MSQSSCRQSIYALAVLVCWANTICAWMLPSNVASRHVLPPFTTPFSPLECQSSFRSTSNYISCRGRRRGDSTRVFSSIEPKWWNKRDIRDLPYDSALRALQAYHEENGDLAIPGIFVVPATNEYPPEFHGVKLAKVYNMKWWNKHIAQHTERVAELNQLGFIWERLQPQWNLFMEGISHYRNIYGNVMVPASFVVPRHDENWPKACWDLPLGSIVQRLRLRHDFLTGENAFQRKKQLDGVGFVWNVSEYKFTRFFRALRHFDRLARENRENSSLREHSIRVPSKFEVPSGHEHGWPPDLWLYPLGAKCMAVRQKQLYVKSHPHRKQALEDIGFRWSGNAKLGWLEVVQAAAIYSQMHGRVLNVPFNFVIPTPPRDAELVDYWPWPERLWGLKLGQRLKDVRLKGAYLKGPDAHVRKAQLDNLGFVWNPKRGRRCYIEQEQREHD